MATNKEKAADTSNEKINNFDIPIDGEIKYTDENKEYEPVDAVCSMIDKVKQNKANEDEEKRKELAKKQHDNAMAAKKAADEKAKQEETNRKANEAKYMRKKAKRNAAITTFCICISSAVFSYIVFGILIWMKFNLSVWLFSSIIGVIGIVDTFIHTYLYRFIREEIYRK